MSTRREVIAAGAAAALVFCGCSFKAGASAATQSRPFEVKGKRVKTIDVHAHCFVPDALALIEDKRRSALLSPGFGATAKDLVLAPGAIDLQHRLATMDAQAIDIEVLSINPFWYADDRDLAAAVVKLQNEKLAELCAAKSDRFAAFASLSLQFPELAVAELEYAIKKLGLRGVAIGGHVNGVNFSHPKFHPVWAKAEALGATLFIHPAELGIPELNRRLAGNGALSNAIGNPLGTTIALAHLIFEGTLDLFPGLKLCAAHGGGYLPSYAARSDHVCRVAATLCDPAIELKKKPTEYLRRIHFDSLVFTSEALRHLVAEVGASQIVLGTDTPFPWQGHPVDHILDTPSLSDSERVAILGGNAAQMLGL